MRVICGPPLLLGRPPWWPVHGAAQRNRPDAPLRGLGRLAVLLEEQRGLFAAHDHAFGDLALLDAVPVRSVVLDAQHRVFHDRPQAARACLAPHGLVRDRPQSLPRERELHSLHLKELLVLLHQRVLRLGEDGDQILLGEIVEGGNHRQAADELRDHAELDQVGGLDQLENLADAAVVLRLHLRPEPEALLSRAPLDDVLDAVKGAAADEEDVRGIDLDVFLLVVLLAAPGSDVGARALDDLEERLLHSLAAHVAGGARGVALARDLVDFVDVDDAARRLLHVVVGRVQQVLDDVLDVLADVARFGQRGGVGDGERDIEKARQRLRQQRLARAGWAEQEDVRFLQLNVAVALLPRGLHPRTLAGGLLRVDALVVVVDGDGEDLLGTLLTDHVVVEERLDLHRRRERDGGTVLLALAFLGDDVVAELDALVADVDGGAGDELPDFPLPLPTEGAGEIAVVMAVLPAHVTSSLQECTQGAAGRATMTSDST